MRSFLVVASLPRFDHDVVVEAIESRRAPDERPQDQEQRTRADLRVQPRAHAQEEEDGQRPREPEPHVPPGRPEGVLWVRTPKLSGHRRAPSGATDLVSPTTHQEVLESD